VIQTTITRVHFMGNIPPKTLTERLRNLKERGALERMQFPEIPPRVEYTLTEKGRALGAISMRWHSGARVGPEPM
jgi:DNA-binding HxlR family transcriptional regulator